MEAANKALLGQEKDAHRSRKQRGLLPPKQWYRWQKSHECRGKIRVRLRGGVGVMGNKAILSSHQVETDILKSAQITQHGGTRL